MEILGVFIPYTTIKREIAELDQALALVHSEIVSCVEHKRRTTDPTEKDELLKELGELRARESCLLHEKQRLQELLPPN